MHCEIFDVKHWNINERCYKLRLSCIWSHFTAFAMLWCMEISLTLSLPTASRNICRLLLSLICEQIGPNLGPNCLYLDGIFERVDFEKICR